MTRALLGYELQETGVGPGRDHKRCEIDVPRLLITRLLIQANAGAGKSYALRRLIEQLFAAVPIVLIDIEGEFYTLREKLPFVLASGGSGADCRIDTRTAPLFARRILEHGFSSIVDLSEMKAPERHRFVRAFLEALVESPRKLWRPLVVVLDEAHIYCPEKGESEASAAVIDLMTRGRKRGFCGVLATQRLSKLHKDAAADCNNKLIGRASLDVDMKRAAEELGFTGREEQHALRTLGPGQFFAFGPALSPQVRLIKVEPVATTHLEPGARGAAIAPPPAPEKIKAIVAALADQANHPCTCHIIADIFDVDPVATAAGRRVGLFWISPDCTFHSVARGGKPFRDRRRAMRKRGLARIAIDWAKAVRPRVIMLENVKEFEKWGPLLDNGLPCPDRSGLSFRRFVAQLRNMGYRVEWKTLKACDFGAPTSRERLFLVARCDGMPIVWPEPTHGSGRLYPYRTAADIIDWSIPCPSIFLSPEEAKKIGVRRPLAENTMRRIARGMFKFVIDAPDPDRFIVPVMHGPEARAHSLHEPLRTITGAHRGDRAVITPYVARIGQTGRNGDQVRRVDQPLSTLTSKAEHLLIAPSLISVGYGERAGQAPRVPGLDKPLGTIVGERKHALVAAFLAKHYGGHETPGSPLGAPIDTITGRDHHALGAAYLLKMKGSSRHGQSVNEPLHTVQAGGYHYAEVRAFLIKFYSTGGQWSAIDQPLPTQTGKDRIGLVTVHGEDYVIVDIGMRMLTPPELFRGNGFPPTYKIDPWIEDRRDKRGRRLKPGPLPAEHQVDMCGNAVPPQFATAMVMANFARHEQAVAA